jgi:hypothetical protein
MFAIDTGTAAKVSTVPNAIDLLNAAIAAKSPTS